MHGYKMRYKKVYVYANYMFIVLLTRAVKYGEKQLLTDKNKQKLV